jgi:hypothetical protein
MRVGKADPKVREILALNYAEIVHQWAEKTKELDGEAGGGGVLGKQEFVGMMSSMKLVGPRGEHMALPAGAFETLFHAADIDYDGAVSFYDADVC